MGLCSTFCDFYKVSGVTCDMFVYDNVTSFCYLGGVSANTNGFAVAPTGSQLVYTRMCKNYFLFQIVWNIFYLSKSIYVTKTAQHLLFIIAYDKFVLTSIDGSCAVIV